MNYLKYLGYWLATCTSIYIVIWMTNDIALRFGRNALEFFVSLAILMVFILAMVAMVIYGDE